MKKELTRKEVEIALKHHGLFEDDRHAILSDLFGKPFEVGDWVVIGDYNNCSVNQTGEIGRIVQLRKNNCAVDCGHNSDANFHDYKNIRHAKIEEIAKDTWEEGEVYRVRNYDNSKYQIRISSNEVGFFYDGGYFSGRKVSWNQYEKL